MTADDKRLSVSHDSGFQLLIGTHGGATCQGYDGVMVSTQLTADVGSFGAVCEISRRGSGFFLAFLQVGGRWGFTSISRRFFLFYHAEGSLGELKTTWRYMTLTQVPYVVAPGSGSEGLVPEVTVEQCTVNSTKYVRSVRADVLESSIFYDAIMAEHIMSNQNQLRIYGV